METVQILIIDDDAIARTLASRLLDEAGYTWHVAENGEAGLKLALKLNPDLILLDCVMPVMGGLEVLRRLREHFLTMHIPVVMLTSLDEMENRVEGLNSGADHYVVKPFDKRDLLARVSATLRRSQTSLAADPLTRLPGNLAIRGHLQRTLLRGELCSIGYIDLDNFKAYVDFYGFERAGNVIRTVARVMHSAVEADGGAQGFIGHIGGDDFLLIAEASSVETICARIVGSFDLEVPKFYSESDYRKGYVAGRDRYGTARRFPLLSLSVAIIDIPDGCTPEVNELAAYAGKCKNQVKNDRGIGWKRFPYRATSSIACRAETTL